MAFGSYTLLHRGVQAPVRRLHTVTFFFFFGGALGEDGGTGYDRSVTSAQPQSLQILSNPEQKCVIYLFDPPLPFSKYFSDIA